MSETKEEYKKEIGRGLTAEAGKVITFLEGNAPTQHNPNPVNITGTITAVSRFIEKRESEFYAKTAHCMVSKSEGKLTLIVNEQSVVDKYTIEASVYLGKRFEDLGINDLNKSYTPKELSNKFRLLRSIFPKKSDHTEIVALLRNIKAKINQEVDSEDNARGGVKMNFQQALETNIPESFTLILPLLEGEDPVEIEVQVILEVGGGNSISCFLESVDGADIIEGLKDKLTTEEVAKIEDKCTVIFY
jgi:hypothetical protein